MCYLKHILVALILISTVACSGTAPRDLKPWEKTSGSRASSQDSSAGTRSTRPDYGPKLAVGKPYTVKRGDTLYAIAFRLGMDFRELAARNGIKAPYTINVGQVLQTSKPSTVAASKSSKTAGQGKSTTTRTASSKPESSAIKSKPISEKATNRQPQPGKWRRRLNPLGKLPRQSRSNLVVPYLDGGGRLAERWSGPSPLTCTKALILQVAGATPSPQQRRARLFTRERASLVTVRLSL